VPSTANFFQVTNSKVNAEIQLPDMAPPLDFEVVLQQVARSSLEWSDRVFATG